jgi:hypothetical protein
MNKKNFLKNKKLVTDAEKSVKATKTGSMIDRDKSIP